MSNILILGGTGFIGTEVVKELVSRGEKVFGLARSQSSADKLVALGATPIRGDVYKPDEWFERVSEMDYAINVLGFFTDGMPSRFSVKYAEKCCVKYTKWAELTFDIARLDNIKAVVDVTGTTIFEDKGVDWVTEETPLRDTPSGFNRVAAPAAKLMEEAINSGLPVIGAVAPSVVYGDLVGASFDLVFVQPLEKGQMGVVGNGRNYITTGHVVDVGRAIAHLTDEQYKGEVFHISDNQPVTQKEFLHAIAYGLGKSKVRTFPPFLVSILGGKCAKEFMMLSQRISNKKLLATGFKLKYERFLDEIPSVMKSLLSGKKAA